MFDHFIAIAIISVFFVAGWVLLHDLFYNGSFLDNNYGVIGGVVVLMIALLCVICPCTVTYQAFAKGIVLTMIADFAIATSMLVFGGLFIWFVLDKIHKLVQKHSA